MSQREMRGLIPPHPWAGCSEERVGSVSRLRGTVLLTQHSTPRSVTYKVPHACVICLQGFLWWQRLESDCPHGGILNSLKEDWCFLMEKWMFIVKWKKQGVGSVQKGECVCPYTCECTWLVCVKSWRWGRITHIAGQEAGSSVVGSHLGCCTFGMLNHVNVFKAYSKIRYPVNTKSYVQWPKIKQHTCSLQSFFQN